MFQAAYRGYYVRKNMIRLTKQDEKKKKKQSPKVELFGAPVDIAGSREIELGHVIVRYLAWFQYKLATK